MKSKAVFWSYLFFNCCTVHFALQFISTDVYGICSRVFCDFGEQFEVSDPTGEEPKEIFVQNITQVKQENNIIQFCYDH